MANGDATVPQSGEAGQPVDQSATVADVSPPTPEELDQLDQSMSTDRKPMGPEDPAPTEVAQNEPPSDVPPSSPA